MSKSLHSPRYQIFRKLLIEARQSAGMTQVEVANLVGKPQSYVSKFEAGERRLDFTEFVDICAALGMDAHAFLDAYLSKAHSSKRR